MSEGGEGAVIAEANGIKFMFTGTSQNRSEEDLGHSLRLKFPLNVTKDRSTAELHFLFLSELAATVNKQDDPRPGHASSQNLNQKHNLIGSKFLPQTIAMSGHPILCNAALPTTTTTTSTSCCATSLEKNKIKKATWQNMIPTACAP